jgi:hypothetical protein
MKNIHDVLRQKELEIQQIQREIEALRLAARLLADDVESETPMVRPSVTTASAPRPAPAAPVMAKPADPSFGVPQSGVRQFP